MKNLNFKLLLVILISIGVSISSCKKDIGEFVNEQFPEPNNMSGDILIDGEIAAPLLDTKLTLRNFIPSSDSSLWAEVDSNDLVHLRMFFKDILTLKSGTIYGMPIVGIVPADSTTIKTDSNKLTIYDNSIDGHLFFNDPKFTFIIKNEIPIVTFVRFDSIILQNSLGQYLDARDETKHVIGAPTMPGEMVTTNILIDKTTIPDFENFFSPIPKFVKFMITLGSDTDQTVPITYGGALTGQEEVKVDVDIDLPLEAHLVDLVMVDTIPFPIDSINNIEQIREVTLKLILDNDFPFGGDIQLSFADTNDNGGIDDIIMNLFEGNGWTFEPSITSPQGETTSTVRSQMTLVLSQGQLDTLKMYHASVILLNATLNSYQSDTGQNVKIYGAYQLGIKLGIKIDYSAETGNL